MNYLKLTQEKNMPIIVLVLTALIFLAVNFDRIFGLIFFMIVVANAIILLSYKNFKFPIINKRFNLIYFLLISVGTYGIFILISSFVGSFFDSSLAIDGVGKVFTLMSQQVPAFSGDKFLSIVAYTGVVTIVETTFFFGTLFEIVMNSLKVSPKNNLIDNITNPRILLSISVISALFALYHFTVRQAALNFNAALIVIFIFAFMSCLLVLKFRRTAEAIGFHAVANLLAMLLRYGFLSVATLSVIFH